MIREKKILAIIPARGGSKGIKNKNIVNLNGKPLIGWTIEFAKKIPLIDKLIVSTDSKNIAEIAAKYMVNVPFVRPKYISKDNSSSVDVVMHAIEWYEKKNIYFDIVLLLEPTSPLREASDIEKALSLLVSTKNASSIVGVSQVQSTHPDFVYEKNQKHFIKPYSNPNPVVIRRQEIKKLYFLEGSLYASYVSALKNRMTFYHDNTIGYEVSKLKSLEIDDMDDLKIVDAILKCKYFDL